MACLRDVRYVSVTSRPGEFLPLYELFVKPFGTLHLQHNFIHTYLVYTCNTCDDYFANRLCLKDARACISPHVANRLPVNRLQDRLGYSAKPELLPLVRLSRDLPPFRARALLEAGYRTPLELAGADRARVAEVFLRCVPFRSAGWNESAVSFSVMLFGIGAQNEHLYA